MSDLPQDGWLIHKAGRGWYRPKAMGYTAHPSEAGRYSYSDAVSYSHPNGWSGPRDGITIKHESHLEQRHTPATPLTAPVTLTEAMKVQTLVDEVFLAFENVNSQIDNDGEFTERAWEQLRAALAALKEGEA